MLIQREIELFGEKRGVIIGHLDVPDIDKACNYYGYSKIKKEYYGQLKEKGKLRIIFSDGSYWHDMLAIKSEIEGLGGENVEILRGNADNYRSSIRFTY